MTGGPLRAVGWKRKNERRGEGKGSLLTFSGEGWKKESEAPGRKRWEVYGDKQVKKIMLIKCNEVKKKAVHVEPG